VGLKGAAKVVATHWPREMSGRIGGWGGTPLAKRSPRVSINSGTGRRRETSDYVDCLCGVRLRANKHRTADEVWAQHVSNQLVLRDLLSSRLRKEEQ
jgi:hypothetical protein